MAIAKRAFGTSTCRQAAGLEIHEQTIWKWGWLHFPTLHSPISSRVREILRMSDLNKHLLSSSTLIIASEITYEFLRVYAILVLVPCTLSCQCVISHALLSMAQCTSSPARERDFGYICSTECVAIEISSGWKRFQGALLSFSWVYHDKDIKHIALHNVRGSLFLRSYLCQKLSFIGQEQDNGRRSVVNIACIYRERFK